MFKTVSGKWSLESDGSYKGIVDASLSGRAVGGSETDDEYEVYCTINMTSGKAAVIVHYTVGSDYKEYYVEMVLDPVLDKVTLDSVIRTSTGAEQTRETLASRNMSLDTGKAYKIRIIADDDVVKGFIDNFLVVEIEELGWPYTAGMHGFECLGTDGQYSNFSDVFEGPYGARDFIDRALARVNLTSSNVPYNTAWKMVLDAIDTVVSETEASPTFPTLTGDYQSLVRSLACIYFLCYVTGGASSGLNFTLGSLTVSSATSQDVSSLLAQLQTEVEKLLSKLTDIPFTVGSD